MMEKRQNEMCRAPKNNDILYRIGMFAAMNHVTVKALRFYEEQGLLIPAYTDPENGYRYYTMGQMAVVHQITALKQAGFTLDEIGRINAGAGEDAVLNGKRAELMEKIAELTRQVAVIDSYVAKRKGRLSAPVLVKTIPAVTVAAMRDRIDSYDDLFEMMPRMGAAMERAGCECALPEYCFTNYPEPGYKEDHILIETCQAVTEAKAETDGLYYRELPQIRAACVFHKGPYSTFGESYETVLRFVEENGYEISGPIRENYIDGIWNKDSENEWLTEIQVPVTKKEGTV